MLEEDDFFFSPHTPDSLVGEGVVGGFMRTVAMAVETQPMEFPEGTIGGKWHFLVTGQVQEVQDVNQPVAQFLLPAGEYAAGVQRLNTGGANLGPAVTSVFTVTDVVAVVTIDVAKSLIVTMG